MKKISLIIAALSFSLYISSQEEAQIIQEDSIFNIKFIVKNYTKKLKNATLKITKDGVLYKTCTTENGIFELNFVKNNQFMFEISSEGYFKKRIAISTELSDETEEIPPLLLIMNLVKEEASYLMDRDLDLLDFPVAFMAFSTENWIFFDKNKLYSDIIIKELEHGVENYLRASFEN